MIITVGCLLAFSIGAAFANSTEPPQPLGERVGEFRQVSSIREASSLKEEGWLDNRTGTSAVGAYETEYLASNGARFRVEIVWFRQDAKAYELLSLVAAKAREKQSGVEIKIGYGTAGFANANDEAAFFRGVYFVRIKGLEAGDVASRDLLVQNLTGALDEGEGDIPVLIKHLPAPENGQKNAVYLNTFSDLNKLGVQQPVLSAIESGGNADAVLATYGPSKVLVVEFNTPQLASENDRRIIARIRELWKLGQPAPTAYRRVGNYSVFVFDAPDEQTAKQLIDQVKYEQVVQWLGENPNIFKEAERRYINTTLGVLVSVLRASGYALMGCLGIGALVGGLLFTYRRAQQKGVTFSDAGGMLRLNLDELTPETNPARLLRDRN